MPGNAVIGIHDILRVITAICGELGVDRAVKGLVKENLTGHHLPQQGGILVQHYLEMDMGGAARIPARPDRQELRHAPISGELRDARKGLAAGVQFGLPRIARINPLRIAFANRPANRL